MLFSSTTTAFTVSLAETHTSGSASSAASLPAAVVSIATGSADQWQATLTDTASSTQLGQVIVSGGSAASIASALAAAISAIGGTTPVFKVIVPDGTSSITVTRLVGSGSFSISIATFASGSAAFADTSTTTTTGTPPNTTTTTTPSETLTFSGPFFAGDTWTVSDGSATQHYVVQSGDDPTAVAHGLVVAFNSTHVTSSAGVLTIDNSTSFTASVAVDSHASSSTSAATTTGLTLAGSANDGDTWHFTVGGNGVDELVGTGGETDGQLADDLSGDVGSSYTSFRIGATVYVTTIAGGNGPALALTGVSRSDSAPNAAYGEGTVQLTWHEVTTLDPAGAEATTGSEIWTVTVGSGQPVSASGSLGSLSALLDFTIVGNPVPVLVTETRSAFAVNMTNSSDWVADTRTHYESATFAIDPSTLWENTDSWTITIDGVTATYTESDQTSEANRTVATIAQGIAAAIISKLPPGVHVTVTAANGVLTLTDSTNDASNPFTYAIAHRGGGAEGAFNMANAPDVTGSIEVPVVQPGTSWLIDIFPFLAPLFTQYQPLGYTAYPVLELYSSTDQLLATSLCGAVSATDPTRTCTTTLAAGASAFGHLGTTDASTVDPLIDFVFTAAGTYKLEVAANVVWNPTTGLTPGPFNVANTFEPLGGVIQQPLPGMNYQLYLSLQGHNANPAQANFTGDTVVITSGTGAGETATIQSYDAERSLFILSTPFALPGGGTAVAPDQTSRFQIQQNLDQNSQYTTQEGQTPNQDSYQVVLTSDPGENHTVTIDITPQATDTYDSDEAFDPNANYGQNDFVQVAVATKQARFTLSGTPVAGEKWQVLENGVVVASVTVGQNGVAATLASIASHLAGLLGATLGSDTVSFTIASSTAFRAGFQIVEDTNGTATVTASGPASSVTIGGAPALNDTWTLTVDGTAYTHTFATGDTTSTIAQALAAELPSGLYTAIATGATIAITRKDGTAVSASLGITNLGAATATANASTISVSLGGLPATGETWKLTVDTTTYTTAVTFGESLSDIAAALGAQLNQTTYNVTVVGRVITIGKVGGAAVSASFAITPDSRGGASVVAQLVFDSTHPWDVAQTVIVTGQPDFTVDGTDALVFPPLPNTVDQIRGPVTIDGGSADIPKPAFAGPLMLPTESNLPLADGAIQGSGTDSNGDGTITNTNATNVSAADGERPGFDPRMNDFPYTIEFLSGAAAGQTLTVSSVSQDILSLANGTAFAVSLAKNSSTNITGSAVFYGTPDQSTSVLGNLQWKQAVIDFSGAPKIGDTWSVLLGTHRYSSQQVSAANAVPSLLAQEIRDAINSDPLHLYTATLVEGLLGNAELLVTSTATNGTFTAQFQINSAANSDDGVVSGTPSCSVTGGTECGVDWTLASYRFTGAVSATDTWSLSYGGRTTSSEQAGTIADLTTALAGDIVSGYKPLVSGSQVTFTTGWNGQPAAGSTYHVAPLNPNTTVDESQQVDTLNVYDTGDDSNISGVLTESSITGLGMPATALVGGVQMAGGISYSELESVNVYLGKGKNTFTIASTSSATNVVDTGAGNDTVYVETISGHTTVDTDGGTDEVVVSGAGEVSRIAGLLTVDLGGDTGDTLLVDDSQDPNGQNGTLTDTTLTGLGMPTVAEEETLTVAAASGAYELEAGNTGNEITVTYGESISQIEQDLDTLFGLHDIQVVVTSTSSTQTTYTIIFAGDGAGLHFPQLQWVRSWALTPTGTLLKSAGYGDATIGANPTAAQIQTALDQVYGISTIAVSNSTTPGTFVVTIGGAYVSLDLTQLSGATATPKTTLVPTLDATAVVTTVIVDDGTLSPDLNTVQTIDTDGAGSYMIHFVLANSQGVLQDFATGQISATASAADVLAAAERDPQPEQHESGAPVDEQCRGRAARRVLHRHVPRRLRRNSHRLRHRRRHGRDPCEWHRLLRRRSARHRARQGRRHVQRPVRRTPTRRRSSTRTAAPTTSTSRPRRTRPSATCPTTSPARWPASSAR